MFMGLGGAEPPWVTRFLLIPNRLHFTVMVLLWCYGRGENEIFVTKKIEVNYSLYFPPVCLEKRGLKSITPIRNRGCYW